MASIGPISPSSGTNVSFGGTNWSNPGNITSSDDSNATVSVDITLTSNYLLASNYSSGLASLPPNIAIVGILAQVESSVGGIGSGIPIDVAVRLFYNGSAIGTNKSTARPWTNTTDQVFNYGSSSDLWGLSIDRSVVVDPTFGFAIAITGSDENAKQARVDHMKITIFYEPLLYPFWRFRP